MRIIAMLISVALLSACGEKDYRDLKGVSPYGVWVTGRGFSVLIFRDNKYQFCSPDGCQSGIVGRSGSYIWLLGAADGPVGKAFSLKARYDPKLLKSVGHEADLDFRVNITQSQLNSGICGKDVCVLYGNDEDQYYFRKVDNF